MNTEKVKEHFRKNKKTYLVGAGCLAVGVVGTIIVLKVGKPVPVAEAAIGVKAIVEPKGVFYNSPVTTVVQTTLERRGHPGNIVRCLETGEVFASQNRAASVMGIPASLLSQHLAGAHENARGFTFEKLGEAA